MGEAPRQRERAFLPFPTSRDRVPVATHFRSTWLVATLQLLRERGLYETYFTHLPPEHRDPIAHSVAAMWLPIDVAMAHYRALDALDLRPQEQTELGRLTTARVQETVIGTLIKLATNAGASPWTIYPHLQRLWARIFRGSAVAVFELGPKDARLEVAGWPCAVSNYVHNGLVGVISGVTELFARRAYAHELLRYRGPYTLAYRVSWA
jgi:hypothetical protein